MIERVLTLCFVAFSLSYLYAAQHLAFGSLANPKSGFLPMTAGSLSLLFSLLLLGRQMVQPFKRKNTVGNWRKLILLLVGLLVYLILLAGVGYFAATFVMMIYFLKLTDTMGWLLPIGIAAAVSLLCYWIFCQYLGVV